MNISVLIGIILLALVGFGGYTLLAPQDDAMMEDKMTEDGAMMDGHMDGDAMEKEGDAMMKNDDDAMMTGNEGDAMMEKDGETMMKDEGAMTPKETSSQTGQMEGDSMMAHGGTYEAYAPEKLAYADSGKVVLFFRASWCPTCKALDADIRAHIQSIPDDVTILDVDYDTETALKQKYGVTYQHTFVQVNSDGSQITKWSGSPTLSQLLAQVQ